ncbi:MAG: recombinase RecA [Planctomycetes bacterium]|nr:recombinase RecA [Planctomycetota bacterium]
MATRKKSSPSSDRQSAIQAALAAISKSHGEEAVMDMSQKSVGPIAGIATGSLGLDAALGGKGLPRGRVIELYGPESSGKSTLAMSVVAQAQKAGGFAVYIDAEHAFDPEYAQKLGISLDGDKFLLSQPSSGEEGLDICEQFVKSQAVDVVVIDSVAALVPNAELKGEIGDSFVGVQARMMSQALRRLTSVIGKTDCVVIFINQLREKIGVMFGNPETTPGGRALKFYSSVRIDVRRIGALKNGDEIVGNRTKATVVKNKVAPPFRRTEFDILYGVGISYEGDVIDLGLQYNLVTKSGAWFSFAHPEKGDIRLGQGREAVRTLLRENPELCEEIADLVREAMNPVTTPAATAAKEQAEAEPAPAKKTTKKKATAKAAAK